jgi:hypothetical protein
MNGDNEFEKFMDENHGDGEGGVNPSCHHRLMLEVISDRAETINNMFNATTEFLSAVNSVDSEKRSPASVSPNTVKQAEDFLTYLMKEAKTSIHQSDYLVSRILDDYDPLEDENDGESKNKE